MASSGGGAAQSNYPTYVKNIHAAILRGASSDLDSNDSNGISTLLNSQNIMSDINSDRGANPFDDDIKFPDSDKTSYITLFKNIIDKSPVIDPVTGTFSFAHLENIIKEGVEEAKQQYVNAFTEMLEINPDGNLSTIIAEALSHASGEIQQAASQASTQTSTIINNATQSAKNNIKQTMTELLNEVTSEVVDFSGKSRSELATNVNTFLDRAISRVRDLISTSVNDALTIMGNAAVTDAVDAYEARTRTRHLRSVARGASSLAGAGAANSSALRFGISLQESERERDVSTFEKDLKLKVFELVLGYSINTSNDMMKTQFINYQQSMQLKVQQFTSLVAQYFQGFTQSFVQTVQSFLATMGQHITLYGNEFNDRSQWLMRQHIMQMERENKFVADTINQISGLYGQQISIYPALTQAYAEANRLAYVVNREFYDKNIEFNVSQASWKWQLWQNAANVLASAAGGTVNKTEKPTAVQSALGGALSGAAAGNMIAPGGLGAGIGGGVGLIAGLLS